MKKLALLATGFYMIIMLIACNTNSNTETDSVTTGKDTVIKIKEENIAYMLGDSSYEGVVYYNENSSSVRPGVLVVHEWWGLNDYSKSRAKQLAEMGYIAMAVDMFGRGKTAGDPQQAMALASPVYQNPGLAKSNLDAALTKLKSYKQTDTANIAAIGYCYGGFVVLNAAKLGLPVQGVVSFHGGLGGVNPSKDLLKASVLVCHGLADKFVPEVEISAFKKGMDSVGAMYTFKTYADATHAFTNPGSTEKGKQFNIPIAYNAAADTASWSDMKTFFNEIFKN